MLFGTAAAAAAAALLDSAWERKSLTRAEYTIRSKKITSGEYRFVFLSDLHDNVFGKDNCRLLRAVEAFRPDAVLIGGDMMTVKRTAEIGLTLKLVEELAERWPICYADGNHETRMDRDRGIYGDLYDRLEKGLRRAGAEHLKDRSCILREDLRVTGITITDDYYKKVFCKKMDPEYIRQRAGLSDKERFQILLAHTPMFPDVYEEWGADLTLAGHFHGGTIQLPGGIGLMTPQFQFFRKDVTGRHEHGNSTMLVSPGLGTHSVNLRLNNRPQIVAVQLLPEDLQGNSDGENNGRRVIIQAGEI
ncbi:MAG: metallophosphoesterase [Stomatobaculum sp.]|nr:metallophosphoesterase [Stomatobaculum sp.]